MFNVKRISFIVSHMKLNIKKETRYNLHNYISSKSWHKPDVKREPIKALLPSECNDWLVGFVSSSDEEEDEH